jgi:membrane protein DedA with SNARE-associated domain
MNMFGMWHWGFFFGWALACVHKALTHKHYGWFLVLLVCVLLYAAEFAKYYVKYNKERIKRDNLKMSS